MPEIAEAQALLGGARGDRARSRSRGVRANAGCICRRAYGQAMMWSKGFAAEETKAAFARATELAARTDNSAGALRRRPTVSGPSHIVRGELRSARELARSFLREAEEAGRIDGSGRRSPRPCPGLLLWPGDFAEARDPLRAGARGLRTRDAIGRRR